MSFSPSVKVFVTGDFVLDHHIYQGQRYHFSDSRHRGVREVKELGGAALIHYLLNALGDGVDSSLSLPVNNRLPHIESEQSIPDIPSSYAVWKPFEFSPDSSLENRVWRTDNAMGYGGGFTKGQQDQPWNSKQPTLPEGIVLSDGGGEFRDDSSRWPNSEFFDAASWIVLKTASPLMTGGLWKTLVNKPSGYSKKLTVIVSAAELRKSAARIGAGLSWDDTMESIITSVAPSGELKELSKCRNLIIACGAEGALWLDYSQDDNRQAHLIYDADTIENENWTKTRGTAFGFLSSLTSAVAWHLALDREKPDLEKALEGGLSAVFNLFSQGHGQSTAFGQGFPAERLAAAIKKSTCRYARAIFPLPYSSVNHRQKNTSSPSPGSFCWSLTQEILRRQELDCPEPAWELAKRTALYGNIALASLPHLKIGNLISVERREIESLRILRRLIIDYQKSGVGKKPLSIGVFGPPGSGKSFAVKEIARTIVGREGWLEFNLSQFKQGVDDLIGAFHQIRDRILRGQTPVAFFDEFDSRDYEWLQYLLAPMQDGAFQEGQATHPVGRCIFVFAGGTSWTFETFGPPSGETEAYTRFRAAKGPDFKSRLDGFLDVPGANRRQLISLAPDKKRYVCEPDPCDIFFPLRRALMIRSELKCDNADKLNIDIRLLDALLKTENYRHGARSLSKILDPLKMVHPAPIHLSLLPPRQQLDLHVNAATFLAATAGQKKTSTAKPPGWNNSTRDRVAAAIHETWRRLGIKRGWLNSELDCDFADLPLFYQNSNRAAAERMLHTLDLVNLTLTNGRANADEKEDTRWRIEYNLELLAEAEHDGWMNWYIDQGWRWGMKKDIEAKTHPCLKPYNKLSPEERNKDWDSLRHYHEYADVAKMKIVIQRKDC